MNQTDMFKKNISHKTCMLKAKALKSGDTIGFISPSNPISDEKKELLDNTVEVLHGFGFSTQFGKNAFSTDTYGVSGGEPLERASDINAMFADPGIEAIWCAQGGSTANQVLDHLDYDVIRKNPKVFIGLSDNTVLINAIHHKTGLITFHGTDAKKGREGQYFDSPYSHEEFRRRFLEKETGAIRKNSTWRCIRKGKAKGRILGGNILCFLKLAGTPYMPNLQDALLILEDYHMKVTQALMTITQLRQMGIFNKIAGVVVGHVYGFDQDTKFDAKGNRVYFEDILLRETVDYDFPILKIHEFGHKCPSTFLPIGSEAEIDADNLSLSLTESCLT